MNKIEFVQRFHQMKQVQPESDYPLREPGRPAAVLIPLLESDDIQVLFTQRALHLKHHPGQISFPGGKQEQLDITLMHTALRETQEEVGIAPEHIEIVGQLPRFRTISRYEVVPYVGFVEPNADMQLDHNEVESVFCVPLAFLMDQHNHHIHWVNRAGHQFPIYFIRWQDKTIWGATAAFVRALSNHL